MNERTESVIVNRPMRELVATKTVVVVAYALASVSLSGLVEGQTPLTLTATSTQTTSVQPGSSSTLQFTVDTTPPGGDLFDVIIHDSSVAVSIVRPDGATITALNAAAYGYVFNTIADGNQIGLPIGSFGAVGPHVAIRLSANQVPGTYSINLDGTALAVTAIVNVNYYSSSAVVVGLAAAQSSYKPGDTVALSALVFEGSNPVLTASANARVFTTQDVTAQTSEGNYVLVSQSNPDSYTTQYQYSVNLTNNGAAVQSVSATAVSTDPSVQIINGSVYFGDVAEGATVTSANTFTVALPAGPSFNPASLQWVVATPTAPVSVALTDSGPYDLASGDGAYSGGFTAAASGDYVAIATITGTSSQGTAFSRTAVTKFVVSAPAAQIVSISDSPVDDNGNGLTDRIVVTANISVQNPGPYLLSLRFTAANAQSIERSVTATLAVGSQQMQVSFEAAALIQYLGVDGPWERTQVRLVVPGAYSAADYNPDGGPTGPYTLSSLDRGSLYFTGQNSAIGVITGAGPAFDLLRVRIGISSSSAQICDWGAHLSDSSGNPIDYAISDGSVPAGASSITLDFAGGKLAAAGPGPYAVTAAYVSCGSSQANAKTLFTISTFTPFQFVSNTSLSISPAAVSLSNAQSQQFTTTTSGMGNAVYYSLNPQIGLVSGTGLYSAPLTGSSGVVTLTATSGLDARRTASAVITLTGLTFNPLPGPYTATQNVTISGPSGAAIRYTLDGTNPSETAGALYSGPITVAITTTIKAMAYGNAMPDSPVAIASYTIKPPVAVPTFGPPAGTYSSAQTVTIATTTPPALIRYTLDGSTPTETLGTLYQQPILVRTSTTINAIAYANGMTDSAVASAGYTTAWLNASAFCSGLHSSRRLLPLHKRVATSK